MTIEGHPGHNFENNKFPDQEKIRAKLLTKQDRKGSLEGKITKIQASLITLRENTAITGGSNFLKGAKKIALFFRSILPQIDLFFTKCSLSSVNKDITGLIRKLPHPRQNRQYLQEDILTRYEIREVRSLKKELLEYAKNNPEATKENLIEFIHDKLNNAEEIKKNPKALNDFKEFFKESIQNTNENSLEDMVALIDTLHFFKLGGMQ